MKRVTLYLLLALTSIAVNAAGNTPDKAAEDDTAIEVSVLTCSPGSEVYSLYGHTAIRVQCQEKGVDDVFNYGVFDFATDNFVWKFVLGQTDYRCEALPWKYFLMEYRHRGSSVVEQILNLTPEESKAMCAYLYNNLKEENRTYRYNYLTNNCTTRVMDCLEACVDGEICYSWDTTPRTYRQMLHEYAGQSSWAQEGNDVLLGAAVDTVLSHRATCFLPEYYSHALSNAVVRDADKDTRCLVKETVTVLQENPAAQKAVAQGKDFPLTPLMAGSICVAVALVIMILEFWTGKMFWFLDVLLMTAHGMAGCLILFMFLFSEHPTLDSNWLVAALNPLPLVALPYVVKAAWRDTVSYWHHFMAIWLALFMLFLPWMPQRLGVFMITVITTLLCRQISYLLHYGKKEKTKGGKVTKKKGSTKKGSKNRKTT